MAKVTLSKPLTVGDKTLEAVDMNLGALTGADIMQCMREAVATTGRPLLGMKLDADLHLEVAAKASGLGVGDLRRLGAADFVEVLSSVQNFLMGSD